MQPAQTGILLASGGFGWSWNRGAAENSLTDSKVKVFDLVASDLDEYIVEVFAFKPGLDLSCRSRGKDPTFVKKEDAVADFLDISHVM